MKLLAPITTSFTRLLAESHHHRHHPFLLLLLLLLLLALSEKNPPEVLWQKKNPPSFFPSCLHPKGDGCGGFDSNRDWRLQTPPQKNLSLSLSSAWQTQSHAVSSFAVVVDTRNFLWGGGEGRKEGGKRESPLPPPPPPPPLGVVVALAQSVSLDALC